MQPEEHSAKVERLYGRIFEALDGLTDTGYEMVLRSVEIVAQEYDQAPTPLRIKQVASALVFAGRTPRQIQEAAVRMLTDPDVGEALSRYKEPLRAYHFEKAIRLVQGEKRQAKDDGPGLDVYPLLNADAVAKVAAAGNPALAPKQLPDQNGKENN